MPPLPVVTYMKFEKGRDHIQKVLHVNKKESIKTNGHDSSSRIYKRPINIMDTNADYNYIRYMFTRRIHAFQCRLSLQLIYVPGMHI